MDRMTDTTAPVPAGYHSLTPVVIVKGGAEAIDFYREAFGAEQVRRMNGPDGSVMHAELRIGDSILMVSEEMPAMGLRSPSGDGSSSSLLLYTPDVDAVHARAVAVGATEVSPVADDFSGHRSGTVLCPYGHRWTIATRIEDVSDEEIERRALEWMESSAGSG
jgi:PhnB protein